MSGCARPVGFGKAARRAKSRIGHGLAPRPRASGGIAGAAITCIASTTVLTEVVRFEWSGAMTPSWSPVELDRTAGVGARARCRRGASARSRSKNVRDLEDVGQGWSRPGHQTAMRSMLD